MGQITAGVGLVSGINSTSIINQLIAIDSAPVNSLKTQIATKTSQKTALNDLASKVGVLKTVGSTLSNLNSFQAATTSSSDPSVLTASAANGAAVGTYNLQVAQLVSSQQDITSGFADPNQTKIGAGTLTISQGGGEISSPINLSQLNGGKGVNRSNFRIIDRAGKSATIDISSAVTLNDVAKSINTALNINIRATIGRNGLILQDQNGFADPHPSVKPPHPI